MINGRSFDLPASKQGKGHYLPILEAVVEQLDALLSYHSKILVFRQDLRLYDGTDTNDPMSTLIRRYRPWLRRRGHKRLGYIWCREQDTSDAQHYHSAFILNANNTRHPKYHINQIEHYWEILGNADARTPKNCYLVIKRGDNTAYQQAFKRLSYLAKVATKDKRDKATNDYSASRIKVRG